MAVRTTASIAQTFKSRFFYGAILIAFLTGLLGAGALLCQADDMSSASHHIRRNDVNAGGSQQPSSSSYKLTTTIGSASAGLLSGTTTFTFSGFSNLVSHPDSIQSLAVTAGATTGQMALTWTAPVAYGSSGTAVGYRLTSTSYPVTTELDFYSASSSTPPWIPLVPGAIESRTRSGFLSNTTYYFNLKAYDGAGNTGYVSNTSGASTLADAVTDPQFQSVSLTSMTISWNPVSVPQGSEGYRLDASTDSAFGSIASSTATTDVNGSTLTLASLLSSTTYYFRVGALNWNNVPNYVTFGPEETQEGAPPTGVMVTNVWVSSITASWTPVANASGYDLEASSTGFTGGVVYATTTINSSPTSLTVGANVALTPNTTYFLQAGALFPGATIYSSPLLSTSTLTSPILGAQYYQVNYTSMTLDWQAAATPPGSEGYEVDIATSATFVPVLFSSITTDVARSTLTLAGLASATTYYVRIGGINWDHVVNYAVLSSTLTPSIGCGMITSAASGAWSSGATWDVGVVPGACNPVTVASGHTVTVDTNASASTTTVYGQLSFSRVVSSTLTLVGGTLAVQPGATLDMGTSLSPITSVNAQLILAYGPAAGQYGLVLNDGSLFTSYGAFKWPYGIATSASGTSVTIAASSATAWSAGDTITVSPTDFSTSNQTETRIVAAVSGGDPLTLTLASALTYPHRSTATIVVADLTRNVVVRSSSTSAAHAAYIHSLATNTTSFVAVNTEFASLGVNSAGRYGVTLDGLNNGLLLSSSTVHDGYDGVHLVDSLASSLSWSVFHNQSQNGVYVTGSSATVINASVLASNGNMGAGLVSSTGGTFSGNYAYANQANTDYGALEFIGSAYSTAVNNQVFCQVNADGIDAIGGSAYITVSSNAVTRNSQEDGVYLKDSSYVTYSNNVISDNNYGLQALNTSHGIFTQNVVSNNNDFGWSLESNSSNLAIVANTFTNNGYSIDASQLQVLTGVGNNLFASNVFNGLSSTASGMVIDGGPNTVIANAIYGNNDHGIWSAGAVGLTVAGGTLGYDAGGASLPDGPHEIQFHGLTSSATLVLRGVHVNPANPMVNAGDFVQAQASLVSFDQSGATGTVRLYGDLLVTGSTLTLDYASPLYTSTATAPIVARGAESASNFTINATNDAWAQNQAVTVAYNGSLWTVTGSVSGTLCTLASGSTADCPPGAPQFNLTIGNAAAAAGDVAVFGLLAGSQDSGVQKQLWVSSAAVSGSSWNGNSGRSRVQVDATGGFHAVGTAGSPTVITALSGGGTYYTFVDSGAFTLQYASMTWMDESGIQLSGSGPFSINNTLFDDSGSGRSSTSTLLSLTGVTNSAITLNQVTYGNGTPNARNYNYTLAGSSTGLHWINQNYQGALAGDSYERNDTANFIVWGATVPPSSPQISAVYVSSLTVTFGSIAYSEGYVVRASTDPLPNTDAGNASAQTNNRTATSLSFANGQLMSNTTYFIQVGNVEGGTTAYANTVPASTATLTAPLVGAQLYWVAYTSVAVNWAALANPPGSEGYELDLSTSATFVPVFGSSSTSNVAVSTLMVSGLSVGTTYYVRVGGINWGGAINWTLLGSTVTQNAGCGLLTSVSNGMWSSPATWGVGAVPTGCNSVMIASGYSVTIDTDAIASTTTINGTLSFSRLMNSTMTLVGGNLGVNTGGILDMGTNASPITGTSAVLVLAEGPSAGSYGLVISTGGTFTAVGSYRSPYGWAQNLTATSVTMTSSESNGWSVGDTLTIGQTEVSSNSETETRVVTAVSGSNPVVLSWTSPLTYTHSPATSTVVADLTRNVVIRSSDAVHSAYVRSLSTLSTNVIWINSEFSGLGSAIAGQYGVTLDGTGTSAVVTSNAFHDGYDGLYLNGSANTTLASNVFHGNQKDGLHATGTTGLTITSNLASSNAENGLYIGDGASSSTVTSNLAYSNNGPDGGNVPDPNQQAGLLFESVQNMTIVNNQSFANIWRGLSMGENNLNNLVSSNTVYLNGWHGMRLVGSSFTVQSNVSWDNNGDGYYLATLSSSTWNSNVAYGNNNNLEIDNSPANRFVGNYLFGAQAGTPDLMTDLGTIQWVGGGIGYRPDGTYAPSDNELEFGGETPAVATLYGVRIATASEVDTASLDQPNVALASYNQNAAQGSLLLWGDYNVTGSTLALDVASELYAGAGDAGVQKYLLFGRSDPSFNHGRSRVIVDASSAFEAVGSASSPTVIGLMSGGTYYTFVDSGIFTSQYVSFTNMDEAGIQLSGSGPFALAQSTFDFSGSGVSSVSTLITLNNVIQSTVTLSQVTYGNATPNVANYNYTIIGSSTGLYWTNQNYGGVLAGDSHERNDTSNFIVWGATVPPGTPQVTAVYVSSLTVGYGPVAFSEGYVLQASTIPWPNAAAGNQTVRTSIGSSSALTFTAGQLLSNTTYYLQVGNFEGGTTAYADTVPSSTSTLTAPIAGAQLYLVYATSVTVNWLALPTPPGSEGYEVDASTSADFIPVVSSSVTPRVAQSTLSVSGLTPNVTYYFRLGGLNWTDTPNYIFVGSTLTLAGQQVGGPTVTQVFVSSLTAHWTAPFTPTSGFDVEASSTNFISGVIYSSVTADATQTSLTVGTAVSLADNTTYWIRIGALYDGVTSYALTVPPSTATLTSSITGALISTATATTIDATWTPLSSAEGYRLEASSTAFDGSGLVYSSVTADETTGALALVHLVPETTYYLRVGGLNWNGVSNDVFIGSTVTLPTPPPTNLAGTVLGISSISWTWNAVLDADTYRFYDATVPLVLVSTPTPAITETGLGTNTRYSRFVTAAIQGVESVQSSSVTLYTWAAVPGGPVFSDVAYTSFTVTWFNSGNPPVTPYEVSISTDPTFAVNVSTPIAISDHFTGTTTTFASLTQNTTYYVRERAQNGDGVFTAFSLVGMTWTLQPPTPSNFHGTAVSVSTVDWTWNAVPSATSYNVYMATSPTTLVQNVPANVFEETGLATNQPYARMVTAIVSGVESFDSNDATVYTDAAMPVGSAWTSVDLTSVSVNWLSNGNPALTHYQALLDTQASFATAITSDTVGTQALFSGLLSNATYFVEVKAENGDGVSTAFDVALTTVTPAAVPQNGAYALVFSTQILVSWTASTNENGTLYETDLSTISPSGAATDSVLSSSLSALFSGLIPDTTYYARVKAQGWAGDDSDYEYLGSTITPLTPPLNLTFTDVEYSSLTLTWSSFVASKLTFDVQLLQSGTFTPIGVSTPTLTTGFTGLSLNTQYVARVRVTDQLDGVSSGWSQDAAAFTLAAPPVNLSTTAVAATSVSLLWDANGNPATTLFTVERSSDGIHFFGVDTLQGTTYTDINLLSGTVYLYRVRALNGDGVPTAYAGPILVKTLGIPSVPKAPTGLWGERQTALGGSVQVTYHWRHVSERTDNTSLLNLAGYQIFASSSLFTPTAQWTYVTTVPSESWSTVTTGSSIQYYIVRTVDTAGALSDFTEIMDDSVDLNHFALDDDMLTRAQIPQTSAFGLLLEHNHFGADLKLAWQDVPDEETGRVVRSAVLKVINTETLAEITDFSFDPADMRVFLAYAVINGNVVAGAPTRTLSPVAKAPIINASNAAAQLSLFRYTGSWIKSTGLVNPADDTVSFTTSQIGRYQIRVASHAPGITLTKVYPRLITPNGDSYNDKVIFQFDNPQLTSLSGMVYDITGSKVADLKPGPVPNSTLEWDGKDGSGRVVPGGIYVYQVSVDGAPATGTVVVAR